MNTGASQRGQVVRRVLLVFPGLLVTAGLLDTFGRWIRQVDPVVVSEASVPSVSQPERAARPERPERLPDYARDPDSAVRRVDEMVRRSGGKFDRLTPLEQRWLDGMTAGHGEEMLRGRAQAQREGKEGGKKRQ